MANRSREVILLLLLHSVETPVYSTAGGKKEISFNNEDRETLEQVALVDVEEKL